MLVDIDLMAPETDHLRETWLKIRDGLGCPDEDYIIAERMSRGIYRGVGLDHELEYALVLGRHAYDAFPFPKLDFNLEIESERIKHRQAMEEWSNGPRGYGMCDFPEQVITKWPWLEETDRCFIIQFSSCLIEEDRAHKQGEYIGWMENPYNEPVGMFQILEIKPEYVVEIEDD